MQNLQSNRNILLTLSRVNLHAPTEVILEFISETSIVCPKKSSQFWFQLLFSSYFQAFFFGQTIAGAIFMKHLR